MSNENRPGLGKLARAIEAAPLLPMVASPISVVISEVPQSVVFAAKALSLVGTPMLLLSACGQESHTAAPVESIRKTGEGLWTSEEIQRLAQSMQEDAQFNDIAHAGNVLLRNQKGEATFSQESRFFEDTPIQFESFRGNRTVYGTRVYAAVTTIDTTGDSIPIAFSQQGRAVNGFGQDKLKAKNILINNDKLASASSLMFKLIVAKEVYNIRAFGMLADYSAVAGGINLPSEPRQKDAVLLLSLHSSFTSPRFPQISLQGNEIADIWAHFMVIPNYLAAKEQNKFTKEDYSLLANSPVSGAEIMISRGFLKKEGGVYKWNPSMGLDDWYYLAAEYRATGFR